MPSPLQTILERARGFEASLGVTYRLRHELFPHWRPLLGAMICSVAYTAARLAEPWPLKFIFDNVLAGKPLRTPFLSVDRTLGGDPWLILLLAALTILALALVRSAFYYYQSVLSSRIGQEIVLKVRMQLFTHLQRLSLGFHARNSTGDLLTRLTGDINMLRELLVACLLSLVSETVIVLGYVTVMFAMEWRLAVVATLVAPVLLVLLTLYSTQIREAAREQRRREGEVASRLQEVLSGIHVVQIFAREQEEEERLRGLNRRSLASGLRATGFEARLNRAVEMSIATATAATLGLGAAQVVAGRLTPGQLIVFLAYMHNFYRPLRRISRTTERAGKAASCAERISAVLAQIPEVREGRRLAPAFRGEVRFEGVEFSYAPGTPVLQGVTLTIEHGQTVALVGPTGAGKSTMLGLVPRLYDPTRGVVRIDGHDVREFRLKSLRDQISVVPQDGMLFGGSARDNIAYGRPDATDEEIEAAARAAHIHDFIISGLPDAYASRIGERGVTLSGGQRQRLAIARAIVKDAPIVLLDEPTTGLDSESEALIIAALARLLEGRTAIIIAHRLSTIRRADVIVVMEEGRIVERGSHDALMGLGGRYRSFYELQCAGAKTESDVRPASERRADSGRLIRTSAQRPGESSWSPSSRLVVQNGVGRPTDPAMPQLDAVFNPRFIGPELERLLGEPTEVMETAVVRYKPGRRCTCRYDVRLGPTGSSRCARFYAKTFASERGATVFEVTRMVTAARACGPTVSLPEPVGYLPRLKLLVQQEVPGAPAAVALITGEERLIARVADALHALHSSQLELRRRHDLSNELDSLVERVDRLCAECRALAPIARHCLRPVHRDFYHDQILVTERGLSVLDFDDATMSEPAVDVANFLAHLRLLSLQATGRADGLTPIATAFTHRYQDLDPALDRGLVQFLEGATLLRLAEIHLPRRRGEWLATRLLEESARLLRSPQGN